MERRGGPKQVAPSLEQAMQEAQQLLYAQEYDAAISKYELVLAMDPNNTKVMDTLGEIFLELQEYERAREILNRSIQIQPNDGASKYMLMGQMFEGSEALIAFSKGVEILRKDLKSKSNRGAAKLRGVKSKLIAGLCAIAELFMTDLCDEDDAEQRCDQVLSEALQLDKTNYEALQLLASFRISQQNNPAAVEALRASYSLWQDLDPQDPNMPSFEFRVATSKLLLELKEWDWAQELLQSLLEEEDSIAEVWYLLSFAFVNGGDPHGALETANMSKRLLEKEGITDPRIVGQVDEVLARATEEAKHVPPPVEDEEMDDGEGGDNDGDDDDDEGMDVDS